MTLDEIRAQFRSKKLSQTEALDQLAPHVKCGAKEALSLLDELLGIDSEPRPMSTSEAESATRWEKGYRGSDK